MDVEDVMSQQPSRADVRQEVTQAIDLAPADLATATWRPRRAIPRPAPRPFDLDACLARLRRVPPRGYSYLAWDWNQAGITDTLDPQEARFWLAALLACGRERQLERAEPELARRDYHQPIGIAEIRRGLLERPSTLPAQVIIPLANLLSPVELVELMLDPELYGLGPAPFPYHPLFNLQAQLIDGFVRHVRPYLDEPTVEELRRTARARIDPALWTQPGPPTLPQMVGYRLAPVLGLHRELTALVNTWPDDLFSARHSQEEWRRLPREILFGLGDPWLVDRHMRRLGLKLRNPPEARAWLAHTELNGLDWLAASIRALHPSTGQRLVEVLCLVQAPQAARLLLELQLDGYGCPALRAWLHREVGNAVAGLLPLAAGRGKLADVARGYLRRVKRRDLAGVIAGQVAALEPAAAARIRTEVLDGDEAHYPPLEDGACPWLRQALLRLPALTRDDLPGWLDLDDLPPLVTAGRRLNPGQVRTLLRVLQSVKLDDPPPELLSALRSHVAGAHREAFAWRLMEQWLGEGAVERDRLALSAVGWLGEDDSVIRLASLVRDWTGPYERNRAATALEALRTLGSSLALVQLANLSRSLKGRLRERARALLEESARQRGLSVEALEDRAVPALGFTGPAGQGGGPLFDFGARRFQAVLAPGPRLVLRDQAGRLRNDLPAISARDDRPRATRAMASWRALKRQLREVVKEQAHRLERAMISGQRWPTTWFTSHILSHPVLALLARLVLWGGYDERRRLVLAFRVNEEQHLVDADESPVALTDLTSVRIVHPIELDETARTRWLQTWSDHELIPPFAQLGRRLYPLLPGQENARAITWFSGRRVPALTLAGLLKAHDWQPVLVSEAARPGQAHCKKFPRSHLLAVLLHPDAGQHHYPDPQAAQDLARALFLRGTATEDLLDPGDLSRRAVPLGEVDSLVRNEVCELLALLQSKGKE